ncbi:hypothetical protein Moror_15059 [Moniliophthora roreri MCA 2997]|uniref:Uncharacterized protein n=1 Tax=Moniliophthora roreri (strain MCA 2997) TaxID=1381753 RepID=V2W8X5_MONRO|nr:hypothetical protein Moror_15059 [Moniliophthora roreri MCA 2997]
MTSCRVDSVQNWTRASSDEPSLTVECFPVSPSASSRTLSYHSPTIIFVHRARGQKISYWSRFVLDSTTPLVHVRPRYTSFASACLSLVEARNDEKPRERVNSLSNTRHPILILFGVSLLKASDVEKLREESSHTHHPSPYLLERHGTVIERTQTFARLMMTSTFS